MDQGGQISEIQAKAAIAFRAGLTMSQMFQLKRAYTHKFQGLTLRLILAFLIGKLFVQHVLVTCCIVILSYKL